MKAKQILTKLAIVTIASALAGCATTDEEKEQSVSMDKVPEAVKTALAKYGSESEVKNVETSDQDGKMVYEFDMQQGARKYEVAFSSMGKYMGTEEDVAFATLPQTAQDGLNGLAMGGKITGCEKAVDSENEITYEATIEKDGKKKEVTVDENGKIESKENGKDKD